MLQVTRRGAASNEKREAIFNTLSRGGGSDACARARARASGAHVHTARHGAQAAGDAFLPGTRSGRQR